MASRKKKAKGKAKPKRRKASAGKPAARKKAAKKKAPARRKPVRAKKAAARRPTARRRAPAARARPAAPEAMAPPGERIGVVTHYFSHLTVAVVKLDPGSTLRVGDNIHIRGHTTDFAQRVDSVQVEHADVMAVGPNDDFGLKVREHVREHDVVYKVR